MRQPAAVVGRSWHTELVHHGITIIIA